jgi:hypothetical protein
MSLVLCDDYVLDTFREMGYEPKMPAFLRKGQTQNTTEEANESRLCTKNRWVVQSYHARIKKWRFLTEIIQNSIIPSLADCVLIISTALNHFQGPLIPNAANDKFEKTSRMMKNRTTQRNIMFEKVQNGELSARSRRKKIEDINFEFPKMSLDDLRLLFFRTYQIKQVRSYVEEHLDADGDFIVEINNSIDDIVRCSIQSGHSNANIYKTWIQ